jgi:hypothetical protein
MYRKRKLVILYTEPRKLPFDYQASSGKQIKSFGCTAHACPTHNRTQNKSSRAWILTQAGRPAAPARSVSSTHCFGITRSPAPGSFTHADAMAPGRAREMRTQGPSRWRGDALHIQRSIAVTEHG